MNSLIYLVIGIVLVVAIITVGYRLINRYDDDDDDGYDPYDPDDDYPDDDDDDEHYFTDMNDRENGSEWLREQLRLLDEWKEECLSSHHT